MTGLRRTLWVALTSAMLVVAGAVLQPAGADWGPQTVTSPVAFGAYEGDGTELDVPNMFVIGLESSQLLSGAVGSRGYAWVPIRGTSPMPSSVFLDLDRSCSAEQGSYNYYEHSRADSWPAGGVGDPNCWATGLAPTPVAAGPVGMTLPLTAIGSDGTTELVWDHWETTGADTTHCGTGDVGMWLGGGEAVGAPAGQGASSLPPAYGSSTASVAFKGWVDVNGPGYTAHGIYVPRLPDTTAPVVWIDARINCNTFDVGTPVTALFNCDDPGAVDAHPTCTATLDGAPIARGESLDTTTSGWHTLTATGTDANGNSRDLTVKYLVRDNTPPAVTCNVQSPSFAVGQPATVTATATDAVDGTWQVSHAADTTSIGTKSVELTATDAAGNSSSVTCAYTVTDAFLGYRSPRAGSGFKKGSIITVTFALGVYQGGSARVTGAQTRVTLGGNLAPCDYNGGTGLYQCAIVAPAARGSYQLVAWEAQDTWQPLADANKVGKNHNSETITVK